MRNNGVENLIFFLADLGCHASEWSGVRDIVTRDKGVFLEKQSGGV